MAYDRKVRGALYPLSVPAMASPTSNKYDDFLINTDSPISVSPSKACLAHTQAPSSSSLTYAPLLHPTFLICQHIQHLKRSQIREQVCSSYNVLPVSRQRSLSLTHCSCILIVLSWTVLQLLTLVCSVIPFLIFDMWST